MQATGRKCSSCSSNNNDIHQQSIQHDLHLVGHCALTAMLSPFDAATWQVRPFSNSNCLLWQHHFLAAYSSNNILALAWYAGIQLDQPAAATTCSCNIICLRQCAMVITSKRCNTMKLKQNAMATYAAAASTCITMNDGSNSVHITTMHNRKRSKWQQQPAASTCACNNCELICHAARTTCPRGSWTTTINMTATACCNFSNA